jgi:hypothetical protein
MGGIDRHDTRQAQALFVHVKSGTDTLLANSHTSVFHDSVAMPR